MPEAQEIERAHRVCALQARAESNGFFSRFYKVRNRIQSFWDPEGQYSWRYTENRREGGYKTQTDIVFDYDRLQARYPNGDASRCRPGSRTRCPPSTSRRMQALPLGGSIVLRLSCEP